MAKKVNPINITNEKDEVVYTLEFNRDTVSRCEKAGFKIQEVDNMPMTMIPILFHYAFRMHHPDISRAETDRILFDELGGLSPGLTNRLQELYINPFSTLLKEDDGTPKNSKMKVLL